MFNKRDIGLIVISSFITLTLACGGESVPSIYFFQTRVIQREICELSIPEDEEEKREEKCTGMRREKVFHLIMEVDNQDRAWLSGLDIDGAQNRKVLGTLDALGGYVFLIKLERENIETGCKMEKQHLIQVKLPAALESLSEASSSCSPLIGRETVWVTTNWECEETGEGKIRTSRRRWEENPTCKEGNDGQ